MKEREYKKTHMKTGKGDPLCGQLPSMYGGYEFTIDSEKVTCRKCRETLRSLAKKSMAERLKAGRLLQKEKH